MFPASASRTVSVRDAWRRSDSTLDEPSDYGDDGWTRVWKPATREVLEDLRDQGFTTVNLEAGGVADPFRRVTIDALL